MVDIATREMLVFFVEWGQTEKKGSLIDRENVLSIRFQRSKSFPLFDLLSFAWEDKVFILIRISILLRQRAEYNLSSLSKQRSSNRKKQGNNPNRAKGNS